MSTTKLLTAAELLQMPDNGFRYDLIEGELRQMPPAGYEHGKIIVRLTAPLARHVEENSLGDVCAAETGFKLKSNPDTVLAPDLSFVRQERVAEVGGQKGFGQGAPDLVVEVVSPGNTVAEMEEKIEKWLEAGARLIWVISPKLRTVTVYRSLLEIKVLTEQDVLDGEEIVPGFRFPVRRLFDAR